MCQQARPWNRFEGQEAAMMDTMLRIGQVAAATGVSVDTVRHYERLGLIPMATRTDSGYRQYPAQAVARVQLVQTRTELRLLAEGAGGVSERLRQGPAALQGGPRRGGGAAGASGTTDGGPQEDTAYHAKDAARVGCPPGGHARECPVQAPRGASRRTAGSPSPSETPRRGLNDRLAWRRDHTQWSESTFANEISGDRRGVDVGDVVITIAAICGVIVAVVSAVGARRYFALMLTGSLVCLGLAGAGFTFLAYGPKDYLVRYPSLIDLIHPYQIAVYSFVELVVGGGALLGILARAVLRRGQ